MASLVLLSLDAANLHVSPADFKHSDALLVCACESVYVRVCECSWMQMKRCFIECYISLMKH